MIEVISLAAWIQIAVACMTGVAMYNAISDLIDKKL